MVGGTSSETGRAVHRHCHRRPTVTHLAPVVRGLGLVHRIIRTAAFLLACLALGAARPAPPQRIIAVGDLHGDFHAWMDIATAAGLVDPAGHWAGGATTLVQLGDVTDRGPDSLKIIRSLQQLQAEAPQARGRVIVVLGNHEAMNLLGDYRYTTPGEYAAFADDKSVARRERLYMSLRKQLEAANPKALPSQVRQQWLARTPLGWIEHKLAWAPTGELGRWATRNPAVARVGDVLFVHGGLSAEYSKLTIDTLNRSVAAAMAAADERPDSVLSDPLGPLWYRGLTGNDPDADRVRAAGPRTLRLTVEQEVDAVLGAYGARHIVIGHTPNLRGIIIEYGGRLARIDTGNSVYYGGPLSWLEIVGDTLTPHTVKRSVQ
jgi:hypothetical protein